MRARVLWELGLRILGSLCASISLTLSLALLSVASPASSEDGWNDLCVCVCVCVCDCVCVCVQAALAMASFCLPSAQTDR